MIRRALFVGIAIAGVVIVALTIRWQSQIKPRATALPVLETIIARQPVNLTVYKAAIASQREYRSNATLWSAAYFISLFGAALFSALAGVILKLESVSNDKLKKDIAAVFAATAALLITVSTAGNFEAKWRANRLAASSMEGIVYKLAAPDADPAALLNEMREINILQNETVVAKPATATHT